ncbi:hypothetical protein NPIL_218961 [Nephila pilipes]|uniref:Uncharacterized protein n=1 Tax=Nephila pilipes TaxID=299642 RepID=A0A8X6Q1T7_NEPPI|nr:hypothetical protein NPIL_218961 [Nephila pilipes]
MSEHAFLSFPDRVFWNTIESFFQRQICLQGSFCHMKTDERGFILFQCCLIELVSALRKCPEFTVVFTPGKDVVTKSDLMKSVFLESFQMIG